MTINTVKNIELKDDIFFCHQKEGISISEFYFTFDEDVELLDKDHCECIHSLISIVGKIMEVRLVTEKSGIDEFIIFNLKNKNLKIRFIR